MKKIIGLGNALVDLLIALPDDTLLKQFGLPKGSMTLINEEQLQTISEAIKHLPIKHAAGGSAANTINGLSNVGVETAFIGKIGEDEIGSFFKSDMESNSILPKLFTSDSPSGRAIAFVTPDSERTFATYLGAAVELSANDLTDNLIAGYDILYIEGYLVFNEALILKGIELAKKMGLKVALDLASYNVVEAKLDLLTSIMPDVDYVFANEEEAHSFCKLVPEDAVEHLGSISEVAVVKCGAQGSLIKQNGVTISIKTIPAKPIDTTGAGDLYAAGFLHGLVNEKSTESCGNAGSLLAGKVIEVMGAKLNKEVWASINKTLVEL